MKKLSLIWICSMLALWSHPGQLWGQDSCFLTNWDTVSGGSHIRSYLAAGECEYEVDTGNGSPPNLLAIDIQDHLSPSSTHTISFILKPGQLNNQQRGHFRVMALNDSTRSGPLFALNVGWSGARNSRDVLALQGVLAPDLREGPWRGQTHGGVEDPILLQNGFDSPLRVNVRFTESSSQGASDGVIEILVDGNLQARWTGLDIDWYATESPTSVSYGVIQVFEPETSGILGFVPLAPSPLWPVF